MLREDQTASQFGGGNGRGRKCYIFRREIGYATREGQVHRDLFRLFTAPPPPHPPPFSRSKAFHADYS